MDNYIKKGKYYFKKSSRKHKKYDAFKLVNGEKKKIASFGDNRHFSYFDKIGLYSHLDHKDKKRRELYYARHGKDAVFESPKWFSHKYLW